MVFVKYSNRSKSFDSFYPLDDQVSSKICIKNFYDFQ